MNESMLIYDEENIRAEALEVLRCSDLLNDLQQFGTVTIDGAMAYRVMLARDIDIMVISSDDIETTHVSTRAKVAGAILSNSSFGWIKLSDHIADQRRNKLPGVWIGLKYRHKGRLWSIDIWVVSKKAKLVNQTVALDQEVRNRLEHLSNYERSLILALKRDVALDTSSPLPSSFVYKAVLEAGITDIKELTQWVAHQHSPWTKSRGGMTTGT